MSGGRGNIKPSDNPKPFLKGNKAALKWDYKALVELGEELIEWMQKPENITINSFLAHKGMWKQQYARLRKRCTTLNVFHARAKTMQEAKINEGALKGDLDSGYSRFMGINHHGMTSERVKSENKNDNTTKVEVVDYSKGD